jgi:DNA repair exonuclease SbcCD ATPase subunit
MMAITGPNEAGKSMVMEMVRFCLFGTAALRGNSDDYKTLKASLEFVVRGEIYKVRRTINNAWLYQDDELLATGVKPVNAKVIAILGFGIEVFDVACMANQGDVEKLAKMRPTERKKMVDEVIGANRIEELAKWCGDEAALLGREIAVLERGLVQPVEPVRPEGYCDSVILQKSVDELRTKQQELARLSGWLQAKPAEPVAPGVLGHAFSEQQLIDAELILCVPTYDFDREAVKAQWEAFELWLDRRRFEGQHPRPVMSLEQIKLAYQKDELIAELERLKKNPVITCPCGQPFTTADERIREIEDTLAGLPDVDCGDCDPRREERMIVDWMNPDTLRQWEALKDAVEVEQPHVTRAELARAEGAVHVEDRRRKLNELGFIGEDLQAVRTMLRDLRTFQAQMAAYEPQKAAYEAWLKEAEGVAAQVQALAVEVAQLPIQEARLREAQHYEVAYANFVNAKADYGKRVVELEAVKAERQSWLDGKAGFNELRERIKTHLVPSLSKVASVLLSQMTGGARNSIVVDEEFEVMVDGQPLNTLSGSGKACANLALRIGLGQVLTNNVFSIFIGDEIDASMDNDRARNLGTSLENIGSRISQIIIITHKIPEAKHVVSF